MRSYDRMSSLKYIETTQLRELFFGMDFTPREMYDFFKMDVEIDIFDMKYRVNGSLAHDIFAEFLTQEDDHIVAKAIEAMIKVIESKPYGFAPNQATIIDDCKSIIARLRSSNPTTSGNLDDLTNKATARNLVEEIRRLKQSIDTEPDPRLAIGTAKDLIESVCKTILSEREKPVGKSPKLPDLIKDTLKELKLVPEGTYEEKSGSKAINSLLKSIGHNLAELRNLYGTGHGNDGTAKGLSARHAKLVAGVASTLALFLIETHEENKASTNQSAHQS